MGSFAEINAVPEASRNQANGFAGLNAQAEIEGPLIPRGVAATNTTDVPANGEIVHRSRGQIRIGDNASVGGWPIAGAGIKRNYVSTATPQTTTSTEEITGAELRSHEVLEFDLTAGDILFELGGAASISYSSPAAVVGRTRTLIVKRPSGSTNSLYLWAVGPPPYRNAKFFYQDSSNVQQELPNVVIGPNTFDRGCRITPQGPDGTTHFAVLHMTLIQANTGTPGQPPVIWAITGRSGVDF